MKNQKIKRSGDLIALGVKSTVKGNYSFNQTFEHIYAELGNKKDNEKN